jgi:uncharacterized protein
MSKKITKNIVVIYHRECTDGFSAAWAAWKKFGSQADYIGIDPGDIPIAGLKNKEIYMIDLIYPIEHLPRLIGDNKKVVAVDHHISNKRSFELILDGVFDIEHSGAVLAWKYFHPFKKVPKLLQYVEEMDLWKFRLPKTKEVIAYLNMLDFDFKEWSRVAADTEIRSKFNAYTKLGLSLLEHENKMIERIISNHAVPVNFFGYKIYAVNSSVFNSQIANALYKKLPPIGIVWVQENDGSIHVSLRSDGTVDVSKLAAKFKNGGGHKAAAGFRVENSAKLPWKKI